MNGREREVEGRVRLTRHQEAGSWPRFVIESESVDFANLTLLYHSEIPLMLLNER